MRRMCQKIAPLASNDFSHASDELAALARVWAERKGELEEKASVRMGRAALYGANDGLRLMDFDVDGPRPPSTRKRIT